MNDLKFLFLKLCLASLMLGPASNALAGGADGGGEAGIEIEVMAELKEQLLGQSLCLSSDLSVETYRHEFGLPPVGMQDLKKGDCGTIVDVFKKPRHANGPIEEILIVEFKNQVILDFVVLTAEKSQVKQPIFKFNAYQFDDYNLVEVYWSFRNSLIEEHTSH